MRATRSTGILVAILALTLTGCSAPTLRQTPLFSDSPAVFAYYENDGSGGLEALNASNGQPMWKTHFGNMYANSYSSAVMANGVVYGIADHNFSSVGAAEHAPPAPSVIAVRASDGKLLWRVSVPKPGDAPIIAADASIVALFVNGECYGFDPATGKQRWHIAEGGYPQLMRHGIIYVNGSTSLWAVRASDGARLWQTLFDYSFRPLVGNDHALYAGGYGTVLGWDAHTGQPLTSDSPYAVGDKTGTQSDFPMAATEKVVLLAINKTRPLDMQAFSAVDGHLLWEVPLSLTGDASLALTCCIRIVGDFIYIIDGSNGITALRVRDGSLAWRQDYPDYAVYAFSVSGGVVFALLRANSPGPCYLDCGDRIVALDATSGASSWRRDVEGAGFFPLPAQ